MPAINDINLEKGIYFTLADTKFGISVDDFPKCDTADELSEKLTDILQSKLETRVPFSELLADNPVFVGGSLCAGEYTRNIDSIDYFVSAPCWVSVHVYSLDPLKYIFYVSDPSEPRPAASRLSKGVEWWT